MKDIIKLKMQLAELEAKASDLRDEIEREEKLQYPRERALDGEPYWFIDNYFYVKSVTERGVVAQDIHYNTGNYFLSEEEASREANKRLRIATVHQKLKDLASQINKDKIDFDSPDQAKYYLYYSYPNQEIAVGTTYTCNCGQIVYCCSSDFKALAISSIGIGALIYYLTDGEIEMLTRWSAQ